ncbi:hypothetical protein INT43_006888 [Umbelopsis isabellina]|uniref:HMG box domain-containing protein n=1 Tax=Mortierella isabellina TaxID=91625 RepID=A0A8H7PY56_MORIS|nr:hypothetical protein INT43_006888 [Umbelopsis isabellina]
MAKSPDTLKQELTAALEAAGKSLLETSELLKKVSSLQVTEEGKKKRSKDPNAPKRPMGSFFLFANDRREKLRKEHPDLDTKEIARKLGEEWKVLSDSKKKNWTQKADALKDRYNKDVEAYKTKEADDSTTKAEKATPEAEAAPKSKKKASKAKETPPATEANETAKRSKRSRAAADSKPDDSEKKAKKASSKSKKSA